MKDTLPYLVVGLIAYLILSKKDVTVVPKPGDTNYMQSKGYVKGSDGLWHKTSVVS